MFAKLNDQRLLVLFGASGSGKSSVLGAGLAPLLSAAGREVVVCTPGATPIEKCAALVAPLLGSTPEEMTADWRSDESGLRRATLRRAADLVIVVDQFEEVFTLCSDEDERSMFITGLLTATTAPGSRCRVVLGVRSDFFPHCSAHPRLLEALPRAQVVVGPMSANELRRVIVEPARFAQCSVESALVADLVAHAHGRPGVLPLLSHVLLQVWARRSGNRLTVAAFQAAGGLEGALSRTADDVYERLSATHQDAARTLFGRLVALGDGTEDTKRQVGVAELGQVPVEVVDAFTSARLLSRDHDRVEITHEALIRSWPRLRNWIAADRDSLQVHRRLTEAANVWEEHDRDSGALYRGTRLAEVRSLPLESLTQLEREFVEDSVGLETAWHTAKRRRVRRTRVLLSVLTALVVVLAETVVQAVDTAREVTRQRNAVPARQAAEEVSAHIASNPQLAAKLALAADALADVEESRNAVLTAGTARRKLSLAYAASSKYPFFNVSESGRFVVAEHVPGVRIVESVTAVEMSLASLKVAASAALSGDDQRLFVIPQSGGTEVWDIANSDRLGVLPRRLMIGTTSRTGEVIAGVDLDRTVAEVWSLKDPRQPRALAVPGERVGRMSVRSDGGVLAVLRTGAVTLELWQLNGDQPRLISTSEQPDAHRTVLEMSPDGKFIALWNRAAKQVVVWDISDPSAPSKWATLPEMSNNRVLISFAADGSSIAVAVDTNVQVWNIGRRDAPTRLVTFTGYVGQASALGHRPADNTFVVVDQDATVWPLRTDLGAVRAELCAETEALSADEWARYFAGVERVPVCG